MTSCGATEFPFVAVATGGWIATRPCHVARSWATQPWYPRFTLTRSASKGSARVDDVADRRANSPSLARRVSVFASRAGRAPLTSSWSVVSWCRCGCHCNAREGCRRCAAWGAIGSANRGLTQERLSAAAAARITRPSLDQRRTRHRVARGTHFWASPLVSL